MSTTNPPDHTLDTIRALFDARDVTTAVWDDAVRHLLDVVGRQHAMLKGFEWSGERATGWRCGCGGHVSKGHAPTCALDALLRETR